MTSPADFEIHKKVKLQDAEINEHHKKIQEIVLRVQWCFSSDSSDIGRTKLITMDKDTEDSPPLSEQPYSLS